LAFQIIIIATISISLFTIAALKAHLILTPYRTFLDSFDPLRCALMFGNIKG